MDTVSNTMPKNVRRVVGPSTFSSLIELQLFATEISLWINYDSKCENLLGQPSENHLNTAGDGELHNCFAVSNVLRLLAY